ncbi:MAG: nicotinate-nucleotide adenylyltransferase [Deltaproteobacteria bacterium]|nr:nicotinate-nucleotide adenylyltransferase [Deltaproteobacteria bacterium]MBW2015841.1 nicotinate-nucleotide adenylyltransferase [Deltaproteobacteria bacterium]MBW2129000.1 nicotinate-nucleotide adenylyltransferase [Deltaproteobacteria bacterium]MBW2302905.1 nicotinate-nucleotide adenylyltransferase [Deltaproteobacteria bacterium]
MSEKKQLNSSRYGILGGTFDPIHLGHLRLAEEVAENLTLERVYLVPSAIPPHKSRRPITSFDDRLAMTRMGAEASPLLEALDLEKHLEGYSYSIHTLKAFHRMYPGPLELFFILGLDAFLEIKTWKEYDRLFEYANFVVIRRPGTSSSSLDTLLPSLSITFEREGETVFRAPTGNRLIYMEVTLMDISSTEIRERVSRGKSIRFLVPSKVRDYILAKGLYGHYENT